MYDYYRKMIYTCDYCNYNTFKKDNFIRHNNTKKHIINKQENDKIIDEEKLKKEKILNEIEKCKKYCSICGIEYKIRSLLEKHEKICIGIDSLTCKRCMFTFTNKSTKSTHNKRGTCKPVSIIQYVKRKNNDITITTLDNKYINDFGKERMDYIDDEIIYIIKCNNYNIIPKYVKFKYLNHNFPENNNIKCKNNRFYIKNDGLWNIIDKNDLAKKIYNTIGSEIMYYIYKNELQLKSIISDSEYEELKIKGNYLDLELKKKDKEIKKKIINLIENEELLFL